MIFIQRISQIYAHSLMDSVPHDALNQIDSDLDQFRTILERTDSVRFFLYNRHICLRQIRPIVEKIGETLSFHICSIAFLLTLSRYKRMMIFPSIHDIFKKIIKGEDPKQMLSIITATPISDCDQTELTSAIQGFHTISYHVDSNLIDGVQIFVNETMIDYSMNTYIQKICKKFTLPATYTAM